MARTIKIALHVIWAIFAITFGTVVGAATGWASHGLLGAIAVGFVGFCFGALAAASPGLILQLFH